MSHTPGRLKKVVHYAAGILLFLVVWWGGSYLTGSRMLPPPSAVARYLVSPGVLGSFLRQVALTTGRGLAGFLAAWAVAVPVGLLMGRREAVERVGFFPLLLLQSAPPLFWVTPLVLWLGTRGMVAPVVAFLVSLPLLTVHTMMAIRAVPDYAYDLFTVYARHPVVIARELYLPHLLPALKSNIHLGILVSIKAAMLAEWFAAQDGFGQTIRIHYQFFAMTEFLAWAVLFLVLIGGLSFALRAMLARALPQYRSTRVPAAASTSVAPTPAEHRVAPHLEVRGLTFGYRRTPLFADLDLSVTADRPMVVYGESGCGKTTLLKCVAGIVRPWSGSVRVDGGDAPGLIFQEDALLQHRDALGNVLLPSMPRIAPRDVRRARACLEQWGLSASERAFPHQLSGGMRKRLAMARAWYHGAAVLLLDEPFVNLDREARRALWQVLFRRLHERRVAALIITHYPEELEGYDVELRAWSSPAATETPAMH